MARKVPYLELLVVAGILVLCVDSQQCTETLKASIQPCMMVIMNEVSSLGESGAQSSSLSIMTIFCKPEVKTALVCIFEVVKVCPDLVPNLNSIPGMANMNMDGLDLMCSAMIDFKANEVCLTSAINSSRYMVCLTSNVDLSKQDPCGMYRASAICSLRVVQEDCPSIVAALNYSLKFSKPPACPDINFTDTDSGMDGQCTKADTERYTQCRTSVLLGLSQIAGRDENENTGGMDSLAGLMRYICGSANSDVKCFLEGYENCPNFKKNSDNTGLTKTFQPKPLKDLVMTGCKSIGELDKHSQCMYQEFKSSQFQKCMNNSLNTYPGPSSPFEPMSCNLYNAFKTCMHDSIGKNCDHALADYLVKWLSIIFRTTEDCSTAAAPRILSSIFLMLALYAAVLLL